MPKSLTFDWEDYRRIFVCHRCHQGLGADETKIVQIGAVNYHHKCVPPNLFHKLCPDHTAILSCPSEMSTRELAARDGGISVCFRMSGQYIMPGQYTIHPALKITLNGI